MVYAVKPFLCPLACASVNQMSKKTLDPIALLRKKCEASSQAQIAREAGVSPVYIGVVLSGKKPMAGKLARFLGLKVRRRTVYEYVVDRGG